MGGGFKALLLGTLSLYQRLISPMKPRTCRFYPTCSAYAQEAIMTYGPWRGVGKAALRLLRCHPFHPGGYDPVD
jgi:putative membrane protein insertion efficiency factor